MEFTSNISFEIPFFNGKNDAIKFNNVALSGALAPLLRPRMHEVLWPVAAAILLLLMQRSGQARFLYT